MENPANCLRETHNNTTQQYPMTKAAVKYLTNGLDIFYPRVVIRQSAFWVNHLNSNGRCRSLLQKVSYTIPCRSFAARTVLCMSIAIVIGPTPPGTGVMSAAF